MYGTVARMKVSAENLEALKAEMGSYDYTNVPGFRASHMLIPDDYSGEIVLVAVFDDKDSYRANADDPAQNERYLRFRALLDADPEWTDGEIVDYP